MRVIRFPRPITNNAVFQIQRFHYRANRYLKDISRPELEQRFADIWQNAITLRDDGKYTVLLPRLNGMRAPTRNIDFIRLLTEVGEEISMRGLLGSGQLTHVPRRIKRLADETWCRRPDWIIASQFSRESYLNQPKMLFKFGEAQFVRNLYERGEAFIRPASSFNKFEGDVARQDDELAVHWYSAGERIQFHTADYYCWCCGSVYDYRLFWDFASTDEPPRPADACLAIHDPDELVQRFAKALRGIPNIVQARMTPVLYYDPYGIADDTAAFESYKDEAIQCSKHFRFAYQWEFRLVIVPVERSNLKPFTLQLGSLKDIADIIVSPDANNT